MEKDLPLPLPPVTIKYLESDFDIGEYFGLTLITKLYQILKVNI